MSNLGDLRQDAQRLAGQNTRIKICGLKRSEDIESVNLAKPDFCGFMVEFPRSSRSVSRDLLAELTAQLDPEIIPVGVFVRCTGEAAGRAGRDRCDTGDPAAWPGR